MADEMIDCFSTRWYDSEFGFGIVARLPCWGGRVLFRSESQQGPTSLSRENSDERKSSTGNVV